MAPMVTKPLPGMETTSRTYTFGLTNAHNGLPPTVLNRWKVTVTTSSGGAGTLKTATNWAVQPIPLTCSVTNLPADNGYYYCQIVYEKADGSTWTGHSNGFRSRP